jgi:ABC-type phosphate/phosphonate transport system substrate-binding protein
MMLALLAAVCGGAQEHPVRVALTTKLFWLETANDILAQAQLVADKVSRDVQCTMTVEQPKPEDPASLVDALESGRYDFVFSNGLDYVRAQEELERRARADGTAPQKLLPVAGLCLPPSPDENEATAGTTRALVLVRRDSGISDIAGLKGKRFIYDPLSQDDCSMLFLQGLLRKQGTGGVEQFFGSVKRLSCEDACFIALQRGSADATCLTEEKLKAKDMVIGGEMRLLTIEASKPYAAYVCFYMEGKQDARFVEQLRAELLAFHQTAEGRALLARFNAKRFTSVPDDSVLVIRDMIQAAEGPAGAGRPGA